jgi:catechol-2,3-dioxygenase
VERGRTDSERDHPVIQGISHIGIQSEDPHTLAAFYRDVLDMQIVGGTDDDTPLGASAFLSNQPEAESHHLAIFRNGALAHLAFKVDSLAALRECYRRVTERGLPIQRARNHGVSFAFYFADPEGNLLEVYWPTGRACSQPYGEPIDLSLPEEVLRRQMEQFPILPATCGNGGMTPA